MKFICAICDVELAPATAELPEEISHGLCLYHGLEALVAGNLATTEEIATFEAMKSNSVQCLNCGRSFIDTQPQATLRICQSCLKVLNEEKIIFSSEPERHSNS